MKTIELTDPEIFRINDFVIRKLTGHEDFRLKVIDSTERTVVCQYINFPNKLGEFDKDTGFDSSGKEFGFIVKESNKR